ncbi:MAG: hypothetical protein NTU43_00845 [Bacteroidetes bacterium]|nr:hypothetical protein [Bacteroidota bacterium]
MKLFKVFAGILGFILLFFIVSLLFPRTYKVERMVIVNKPVYESYAFMSDIRNWKKWSPWNSSVDSTFYTFYSKQSNQIGAKQYLGGHILGVGSFTITEAITNEKISYFLSMNEGLISAKASFVFADHNGRTKLSWVDEGDVGYNPFKRYMMSYVTGNTAKSFDEGLIAIKHAIETN